MALFDRIKVYRFCPYMTKWIIVIKKIMLLVKVIKAFKFYDNGKPYSCEMFYLMGLDGFFDTNIKITDYKISKSVIRDINSQELRFMKIGYNHYIGDYPKEQHNEYYISEIHPIYRSYINMGDIIKGKINCKTDNIDNIDNRDYINNNKFYNKFYNKNKYYYNRDYYIKQIKDYNFKLSNKKNNYQRIKKIYKK